MLYFSLVMNTQEGGSSSDSGSIAGTKSISEQMHEFILLEITRGILEQTHVIFGLVKEEILEILDERLRTIRADVMAIVVAQTLSFCEREVDLEHLGKRGSDQVQAREGRMKRPKTSDQ